MEVLMLRCWVSAKDIVQVIMQLGVQRRWWCRGHAEVLVQRFRGAA